MTEGPMTGNPTAGADAPATEASGGDPALIGRTIASTFTIEKFLGGGAMGAVYRARQVALERNVAVKVMHRAVAVDPSFVARFHREAKAASRLDHPNSMRVLAFGEEPDGLLYIAMEFLDGRDLYRVIHEDWPLPNARIGDVVMQALAAIAVAHDMGVIHRDLKPENIMILRTKNDEGRDDADLVKVCDFGIAKITEKDDEPRPTGPAGQKLTTQGLVVGTPEYMSPEQARGEKLDARSDLYSMGVILYQLLTGRTPFTGDTPLAVVLKHITESPQPPHEIYPGVHKGLEEVAVRALAKDKAARFQSARDMRNAIRAALEGRPMPVDVAAATDVALPSVAGAQPGTAPMVITQGAATQGAPGATGAAGPASAAAIGSAPTIAGTAASAQMTPLGTAAAPPEPKKSRAGLVVGLALVGVLGVGGVIAAPRVLRGGSADRITTEGTAAPATAPAPASASPPASPASPTSTNVATAEGPGPVAPVVDPKTHKPVAHGPGPTSPAPRGTSTGKSQEPSSPPGREATPAASAAAAPAPAPAPEPAPPPATAAAPQPPTPAAPAAPVAPQPPPFNPATCKASLGSARASGAVNAKDLTLNGTSAAWTRCAQGAIKERPGAPISAVVHLMFSDNRSFRGASCNSCPPPLASCIASSTGKTVSVSFRGGDVTGDPAFDVPVTITCD